MLDAEPYDLQLFQNFIVKTETTYRLKNVFAITFVQLVVLYNNRLNLFQFDT